MSELVSTDDVPAATRSDYFHDMIRDCGLDLRFPTGAEDGLWSQLAHADLGAVNVGVLSTSPLTFEVHRTPRLIRHHELDAYRLNLLISGGYIFTQDGRDAALRPGDFTLSDLTRPFRAAKPGHSAQHVASFTIPRTPFPLPSQELAEFTAVRMSGQRGVGALVSSLLLRLAQNLDGYDPAEAVRISTIITDLLVVALAGRLDRRSWVPPETHRRALLHRIYTFIDAHLGNPELSPSVIAAAHHICTRYLHKLFETEGVTVGEWIRSRRLDRCRRDLTDPAQRGRPISAIAARWGFVDATHFSRVFRATYGIPPHEYRTTQGAFTTPS